jgi:hypothetical protein
MWSIFSLLDKFAKFDRISSPSSSGTILFTSNDSTSFKLATERFQLLPISVMFSFNKLKQIRVITKLPNSEQSYKGNVKTHKYINRQNQSTTGKL